MATAPPSPLSISGQSATRDELFTPAIPFAPSPTIMVYWLVPDVDRLTISASDPSPPLRFSKWLASDALQTGPLSSMASVERQMPLSLPRKISSGLAALGAMACWYSPTAALMQVVALVVSRHAQPAARLHFHRSLAPART